MRSHALRALILVALIGFATRLEAQTTAFSDGTFSPSDWSMFVSGAGSASANQIQTGGDPGAYRSVTHFLPVPLQFVTAMHLHGGFVWDPATFGPIDSVDFAIDRRSAASQIFGPAVEQGGVIYAGPQSFSGTAFQWGTVAFPGLSASDFVDAGMNSPSFGPGAPPLTFGFFTANIILQGTVPADYDDILFVLHHAATTGSGEDLDLRVGVNAAPVAPFPIVQSATAGDAIVFHQLSPFGTFDLVPCALIAQVTPTGTTPMSPPGYPEISFDPAQAILLQGPGGPFDVGGILAPGGNVVGALVPPGLGGSSVILQSLAITTAAGNGFFASSPARELQIQP